MFKKFLIAGGIMFSILLVLAITFLRPVPIVPENECLVVTGSVIKVEEGSSFDVIFTLDSDRRKFYINRGLENGLTLAELREKVLLKDVTIKYPEYTSPFGDNIVHLSKLEMGDEVLYSELK